MSSAPAGERPTLTMLRSEVVSRDGSLRSDDKISPSSPSDELSAFKVEGVDAAVVVAASSPSAASSSAVVAEPAGAAKVKSAPPTTPMFEAFTLLLGKLQEEGGDLWKQKAQSAKDARDLALFPTKALAELTRGLAYDMTVLKASKDFEEAGNAFEALRQTWAEQIFTPDGLKSILGREPVYLQQNPADQVDAGKQYSPAELQAVLYDLLDTKTAREAFTKAITEDRDVQGKLTALRASGGNTQDAIGQLATLLVKVFDSKVLTEKFGYKLSDEQKTALASVLAANSQDGKPNPLLSKLINPPSGEFGLKVGAKRVFVTLAIGFTAALAVTATMSVLGLVMLTGVGSVILMGATIAASLVAYKTYRDRDKIKNLETLKRQNAVFSTLRKEIGKKFVKKDIQRTVQTHTMASKLRTAAAVTKAAAKVLPKVLRHGAAGMAKVAAGVGVGAVGYAATAATLAASLPVAGVAAAGVAATQGAKRAAASAKDALEARSDRKLVKSTEKFIGQLGAAEEDLKKRVQAIEEIDESRRTVKQKENLANLKEKLKLVKERFAAVNPHARSEALKRGGSRPLSFTSGVATVSSTDTFIATSTPLTRSQSAASLGGGRRGSPGGGL